MLIIILLGFHNYKRSGVFYIMPTEGKYAIHRYFANDVLSKSLNINPIQSEKLESELTYKWLKDNKIKRAGSVATKSLKALKLSFFLLY